MSTPDELAPPRLARSMWKRFILGGSLVVALVAGTTATAFLLEVDDISSALAPGALPEVRDVVTQSEAGQPQTILLLGSDARYGSVSKGVKPLSDTIMLVRLDSQKKLIALMSIPRDLKVEIELPNGNTTTEKINAAYTYGGPRLAAKTVKDTLDIDINHVVNVAFNGFAKAVDFLGCVYADIDRRYFNDNSGYGEDFAKIDVKAGYQKLCGADALDYVRFRHEDTDLVRAARQQDFLRSVKEQISLGSLISDRKKLLDIFGRYTQTDIQGGQEIKRLLDLAIFSSDKPVREVRFRTELGPSFVESSRAQIKASVEEFLGLKDSPGPRGELSPTSGEREAARRRKPKPKAIANLENAKTQGEDQAIAIATRVPFPVYFPRLRTRGAIYVDEPRVYTVKDSNGKKHSAYRIVIKKGLLGEYYGVQGMKWTDPPVIKQGGKEQKIGNRTMIVFKDGDRIRMIAWKHDGALYWVSNTLLRTLSNDQMKEIARSLQTLKAPKPSGGGGSGEEITSE